MVSKEAKKEYNTINLVIRRQKTQILFLAPIYKECSEIIGEYAH